MSEKEFATKNRGVHTLFWTGVVFIFLIVIIIIAPMALSTQWGNKLVLSIVNRSIPGTLEAHHIHLDWFEGVAARDLVLYDPDGGKVFQTSDLSTTLGLWRIIWGTNTLGRVVFDYPVLLISVDENGITNVDRAFGNAPKTPKPTTAGPSSLQFTDQLPIMDIGVHHGSVVVDQPGQESLHVDDIHAHLRHPKKKGILSIEFSGQTKGGMADILLTASRPDVSVEGKAITQNFPIVVADQLINLTNRRWRGFPTALLGDKLDLNFRSDGQQATLDANSPNLRAKIDAVREHDTFRLKSPAIAQLTLTPAAGAYLQDLPPLTKPSDLKLVIEFLRLTPDLETLTFDANLTASPVAFESLTLDAVRLDVAQVSADSPIVAELEMKGSQASITGNATLSPDLDLVEVNLQGRDLPVALIDAIAQVPLQKWVGDRLSFNLHHTEEELQLSFKSPLLELSPTRFSHEKKLTLLEPTALSYTVIPQALPTLVKPATGRIELETLSLPIPSPDLQSYNWRSISTTAYFHLDEAILESVQLTGSTLSLNTEALASGRFIGFANLFLPKAKGVIQAIGADGFPIQIEGSYILDAKNQLSLNELIFIMETRYLEGRLLTKLSPDGKLSLTSPALGRLVIDPEWITDLDPDIAAMLQRAFSIQFLGKPNELDLTNFSLENLTATGNVTISPIHLKSDEVGGSIDWLTGTGELDMKTGSFSASVSGKSDMAGRSGDVSVSFSATDLINNEGLFDPAGATAKGQVALDPIPSAALALATGRSSLPRLFGPSLDLDLTFSFNNLNPLRGKLEAELTSDRLELDAYAQLSDTSTFDIKGKLGKTGTLSLIGEGEDLIGPSRAFTVKGELKDLPVDLAVEMLPVDPLARAQAKALLGTTASGTFALDIQGETGPLRLTVQSDLTHLDLEGILTKEALTLTKPLEAAVQLTPTIGQLVLGQINPLLVTALRSEAPVTVRIEPEGFSFPRPYREPNLQVGSATLNLGKLWVRNSGAVRALLSVFKTSQLNQEKELLVWSTPLYCSVRDGVVHLKRMDTLIGTSLQVASWGRVDLPGDKVRMTLAIPGYSLRKILGVKDIPDSYYLLLPIRGPVDDAAVDSKQATPAIAALLARKEGKAGQIIGGVLDLVSGNLLKQKDVPPPTTQPFPWNQTGTP